MADRVLGPIKTGSVWEWHGYSLTGPNAESVRRYMADRFDLPTKPLTRKQRRIAERLLREK